MLGREGSEKGAEESNNTIESDRKNPSLVGAEELIEHFRILHNCDGKTIFIESVFTETDAEGDSLTTLFRLEKRK